MTRIAEWQKAVRDCPDRPPPEQRLVLDCLALRLDWKTGCGSASSAQLAADAGCAVRTVWRATGWAREAGLLIQSRRGHHTGNGQRVASEWRLAIPPPQPATADRLAASQPATADRLAGVSTCQPGGPNLPAEPSQPASGAPPSRPRSSRPRSSAARSRAPARTRASEPSGLARYRAQTPDPRRAPPCEDCGRPYSPAQLADDDFYAKAMAGTAGCIHEAAEPGGELPDEEFPF